MAADDWRANLAAAIAESGRSERDVSLSAKPPNKPSLGPGYIHSILKEGKDPTVGNLRAICDALGVSIIRILAGFDITPEREAFLRALVEADKEDADAVVRLLGVGRKRSETQAPPSG